MSSMLVGPKVSEGVAGRVMVRFGMVTTVTGAIPQPFSWVISYDVSHVVRSTSMLSISSRFASDCLRDTGNDGTVGHTDV